MKLSQLFLAGAIASLVPLTAAAQHADIKPNVQSGRVVTDGWIDATSELLPGARVFGYDFQEDPLDPYVINDPGFNTVGPSALPPASQLSFNVLDVGIFGLPANLSYWSGSGPVGFDAVPSGETLRLNRGTQDRTIGSATSAVSGFAIGTVGPNGSLHQHLNSFLRGSDGNVVPGDGIIPADGIYLVPLELASSDSSIAPSQPLFLVYNNGLDEAVHDAAIDWVETNLVPIPEPSTIVLWTIAGAGLIPLVPRLRSKRLRGRGRDPIGGQADGVPA